MKIVAYYIGENVGNFIQSSMKSLLTFIDFILFIDGGSTDNTLEKIRELNDERIEILKIPYEHWSSEANGNQRNNALNFLKEKFKDEEDIWVLRIDPDEVLDDNGWRLKQLIEYGNRFGIDAFHLKMEHCIWNLGLIDATRPEHFVPFGFFKLNKSLIYPNVEHPVLCGVKGKIENSDICTLWHFRECLQLFEFEKKFQNNFEKSNMHTQEELLKWYYMMILGTYPTRKLDNVDRLPNSIKERFLRK